MVSIALLRQIIEVCAIVITIIMIMLLPPLLKRRQLAVDVSHPARTTAPARAPMRGPRRHPSPLLLRPLPLAA